MSHRPQLVKILGNSAKDTPLLPSESACHNCAAASHHPLPGVGCILEGGGYIVFRKGVTTWVVPINSWEPFPF